jgi:D-alanyl-D-alanine carboxypeptidase
MNLATRHGEVNAKAYLDSALAKSAFPGVQYLVLAQGGTVFAYIGGRADLRGSRPMDASTTMMAYSMTKTFTAAAVLQLVELGRVALDESLSTYVPAQPYGPAVKIHHLLAQTSGIPNPIPLRWVHRAGQHASFDEDAALDLVLLKNPRLAFPPGTRYAYSNISYWLLGKVIETAGGKPYADFMQEHILAPLRLTREQVDFVIPDPARHAKGYLAKYSVMNLAKGFLIDGSLIGGYEGRWLHVKNHYLNGPAFGGLVGSAADLARFLHDQLQDHSVLFGDATSDLFYTEQPNNEGQPVGMTLGWHIGNLDGSLYLFKEGGGGGYHSEMRIYPSQRIATIIMVNATEFKSSEYLHTLDRAFLS